MTKEESKEIDEKFRQLLAGEGWERLLPDNIFMQAADYSPNPVIITNRTGKIIYLNNTAKNFIRKVDDSQECSMTEPDTKSLYRYLSSFLSPEGAEITAGPVEIIDNNGNTRFLNLHRSILTGRSKSFFCFLMTDLTDKVLSEQALIHSEKDKTLILNSIHENLVYYDRDFRIIWANQDPADSLGLQANELKGHLCYELWYGLDSPCRDCTVKKVMRTGKTLVEEKTKSGGRSIKVAAYPVFDDSGEIIGAVESVLDISRRKIAEKALDDTMKNYWELFTTMTNGFVLHEILTDESGMPVDFRFLDLNPAFEEMTGLISGDLIGKTVLELFPGYRMEWIQRYGRVALTGKPNEFTDYNHKFGKYYHIYVYSPEKGRFAAIFSDITDVMNLRKKQERLMIQINRNFEQLAILNDEIRNPLQVITGYALMGDPESANRIMDQISIIDKLINELDKRWLESGKIREYLMKHHAF